MIKISELKKAGKEELKDIQELMDQLSSDPGKHPRIKLKAVNEMAKDKRTIVLIAQDGKHIIGLGTLSIMLDFHAPGGHIDNVVVHTDYRGQGIGEKLSRELISSAKKKKLGDVDLTSKPARVAANKLYQKLEFKLRETNSYRLKLK